MLEMRSEDFFPQKESQKIIIRIFTPVHDRVNLKKEWTTGMAANAGHMQSVCDSFLPDQ